MKKITFLLLLSVCTTFVYAQDASTKKADKLYERLKYVDAAEAYQKLITNGKSSDYVFEQLGNSYYFINDTKNAEAAYKNVVKSKNVDSETVYNYAQTLKSNGNYPEYNTWMQNFSKMKPADSRAVAFMKNPNYIPTLKGENPGKFAVTKMEGLNSKFSDFGGTMVGNEIYFATARNTSGKNYGWNDEPYLDIYKMTMGGTAPEASKIKGDVNTKYHESTIAISPDGKRMYFDRNDYYRGKYDKSDNGINQINIYYATNEGGEWKDIQKVPFNSSEYSTGHPALTADGNTLYFTSDKPGGKGMSDIYMVSINKSGGFGSPIRLGDNINTEGKEAFPFVDGNGTLYFSSDGHLGLGGLDVLMAEANTSGFDKATNMGGGINSADDDFAFTYNSSTGDGFVSSNRPGGMGSDDIYKLKAAETCEVLLALTVINQYSDEAIGDARVELYDNQDNKLETKNTDASGNVQFTTNCNQVYVVKVFKEDFESNQLMVEGSKNPKNSKTINLRPIEDIITDDKVVLNPILFDFDKHNIKSQAAFELDKLVSIMKKYPNMVTKVEGHTDNRGTDEYNMNLSEKRAQSTVQYVISKGIAENRISGQGFGESQLMIKCGDNCTEEEHQKNRRSEFIIVKKE